MEEEEEGGGLFDTRPETALQAKGAAKTELQAGGTAKTELLGTGAEHNVNL